MDMFEKSQKNPECRNTLELHEINQTEPKIGVVVEELRDLCFCANLLNEHHYLFGNTF